MVQDAFLGTLTTLSLLVSPLAPGSLSAPTYSFDLEPNSLLLENCPSRNQNGGAITERSRMRLSIEGLNGHVFTLGIKARVCNHEFGARDIALSLNLPNELLDPEFLGGLTTGMPYVIGGLPSLHGRGRKERVKITRLERMRGLDPVRVEWIPYDNERPAYQPMTIWMDPRQTERSQALGWKKVSLDYKIPAFRHALFLNGDLRAIEASR